MAPAHRLLLAGALVGPLFLVSTAALSLRRADHDLGRDPLSALSLGDLGWAQVLTFVVAGGLLLVHAAGLWVVLGRDGRWAGWSTAAMGAGLLATGIFRVDPPDGGGGSWPGVVHDVASAVAINAGLFSCVALARWFGRHGRPGWARYGFATVALGAALGWWGAPGTVGARQLAVLVTIGAWLTLTSVELRRGGPGGTRTRRPQEGEPRGWRRPRRPRPRGARDRASR